MNRRYTYYIYVCVLLLMGCISAAAQEVVTGNPVEAIAGGGVPVGNVTDELPGGEFSEEVGDVLPDTVSFRPMADLPPLRHDGTVAYFPRCYSWGGWGLWNLHEGFNAALDMGVSVSFGRNRFPGAVFGTEVSAMYVFRPASRFTLAAGGFYDHTQWNGFGGNRFGINIMAGYQINDRLSVYAYGSKAFAPGRGCPSWRMFPFLTDDFSERIGGMLHVKVSDAVSFSVCVEGRRTNYEDTPLWKK